MVVSSSLYPQSSDWSTTQNNVSQHPYTFDQENRNNTGSSNNNIIDISSTDDKK
jgi:hypothetical protein